MRKGDKIWQASHHPNGIIQREGVVHPVIDAMTLAVQAFCKVLSIRSESVSLSVKPKISIEPVNHAIAHAKAFGTKSLTLLLQVGFGSGFKSNSAVWKALRTFKDPDHKAWADIKFRDISAMWADLEGMGISFVNNIMPPYEGKKKAPPAPQKAAPKAASKVAPEPVTTPAAAKPPALPMPDGAVTKELALVNGSNHLAANGHKSDDCEQAPEPAAVATANGVQT